MDKVGSWAFIVGLVVAIIFGIPSISAQSWVAPVLVILGLIIGFLNITEKEVSSFLIAAIALVVAGNANLSQVPAIGGFLSGILGNFVVLMAPAAVVVAVKAIWELAKAQ
jgi:hypothetical protein|tara:strand:+ start:195 stop:524 length:330 start_codon:yes stop_codon:yes gene_type:complete